MTSVVLFRGLKGSAVSIVTVVMGFLQICAGVILLQLSKSAKDVPDAAVFAGDLDQVRTVAEQEEPESEPKADAIRGAAAIIRRLSTPRQKMEAAEARRVHEDRLKDQMEPIRENEFVKWDGLKRRKTLRRDHEPALERRKTLHPPLGMAHFPDEEEESRNNRPNTGDSEEHGGFNGGFMNSFRRRAHSTISLGSSRNRGRKNPGPKSQLHSVTLTENALPPYQTESTPSSSHPGGTMEMSHVFGLPPDLHAHGGDGASDQNHSHGVDGHGNPIRWADRVEHENVRPTSSLAPTPPPHGATRSFSFQNVFHRRKSDTQTESSHRRRPSSRLGLGSRQGTRENGNSNFDRSGTEEEQVGLVKRDSNAMLPLPDYTSEDEDWALQDKKEEKDSPASAPSLREKDESEDFDAERQQWIDSGISPQRRGPPPSARRRDDQDPGDAFI